MEGTKAGRPIGQSDILTTEEITKLLLLPDRRTKDGARDYALFLVLCNSPARKGEIVRLKVANLVDEGEAKYLTYQGLKKRSKKPYYLRIHISDDVYKGILRYVQLEHGKEASAEMPLFLTLGKHGHYGKQRLTAKSIDCLVSKYVKLADISKRITPHSFRATYLTLRAPGRDPSTLMALSGHSNLSSLLPYLRATEARKKEAALAFAFA